MQRFYSMTKLAQQATWTKTTGGNFIPQNFHVAGEPQTGYVLCIENKHNDILPITKVLTTLYCCKRMMDQLNTFGNTDSYTLLATGALAWRNIPMPLDETEECIKSLKRTIAKTPGFCWETGDRILKGSICYFSKFSKHFYSISSNAAQQFLQLPDTIAGFLSDVEDMSYLRSNEYDILPDVIKG